MPPYKVYKNDQEKLKAYAHRMAMAEREFKNKIEKPGKRGWARYRMEPQPLEYTPTGHRVNVPAAVANIDSMFAALTAVEVDFSVRNLAWGTPDQARLAAAGMREVWREQRVQTKSEDVIKDALITKRGWLKVDYEYAEEEQTVDRADDDIVADVDRLFQAAEQANEPYPTPDQVRAVVPSTEKQQVVMRDRIVVDYVPWDEVRVDPTATRFEDARWVCQVTKLPVYEVVDNPLYREYVSKRKGGLKDLENLKSDSTISNELLGEGVKANEDDERVTVYEMHDFETGTACTFTKAAKFLLYERATPFAFQEDLVDRSVYVPLDLRRGGVSDMQMLEPIADELTIYRSNFATYLARHVAKLLAPEGALTEGGKEALKSREWGSVVEYDVTKNVSGNDFKPLEPPALPQELFRIEERLELSMRDATGLNELMRGNFPDRKRTATETNEVVAASTVRQSEKRNRLEEFYISVARRILVLMQMMYDAPRVSRITGEQADEVWEWTAEDIVLEADLEITLSPKEQRTLQTRREDALGFLNLIGTPALQPYVDVAEGARWAFEEMGYPREVVRRIIKNPEEQEADQQSAMEQAAQQAAIEATTKAAAASPDLLAGDVTGAELGAEQDQLAAGLAGGVGATQQG